VRTQSTIAEGAEDQKNHEPLEGIVLVT